MIPNMANFGKCHIDGKVLLPGLCDTSFKNERHTLFQGYYMYFLSTSYSSGEKQLGKHKFDTTENKLKIIYCMENHEEPHTYKNTQSSEEEWKWKILCNKSFVKINLKFPFFFLVDSEKRKCSFEFIALSFFRRKLNCYFTP